MPQSDQWDVPMLAKVLRRRFKSIALLAVVAMAAALAFSFAQTREYTSTSQILFRQQNVDQALLGTTALPPSSDPTRQASTNQALLLLPSIAEQTGAALTPALSRAEVQSKISISAASQSEVFDVSATDRVPRRAADIANAYAAQVVQFQRGADRAEINAARAQLEAQLTSLGAAARNSAQAKTLRAQEQQLAVISSLQTGEAEVVQPALLPTSPSSPSIARNAILGLLVGLILGVALALLREGFDRRIKDVESLEEVFGAPVLAAVTDLTDAEPATESFRTLRAQLRYFSIDKNIRTVLVTSAVAGEGKTTVASNLARAAGALPGSRTLLIEADLRQGDLAGVLGVEQSPGLVQVLSGEVHLHSAIQRPQRFGEPTDAAGDPGEPLAFDVLVAGASPPNAAEMLDSQAMVALLASASADYDLIIIDTAPLLLVADSMPLLRSVSGVLAVASLGSTKRDALQFLRKQLDQVDAPVLGLVANRVPLQDVAGGYGYGYEYRDSKQHKSSSDVATPHGRIETTSSERQPDTMAAPTERIRA
jgi:succinoglycan biosynthesis transport protein ExoP